MVVLVRCTTSSQILAVSQIRRTWTRSLIKRFVLTFVECDRERHYSSGSRNTAVPWYLVANCNGTAVAHTNRTKQTLRTPQLPPSSYKLGWPRPSPTEIPSGSVPLDSSERARTESQCVPKALRAPHGIYRSLTNVFLSPRSCTIMPAHTGSRCQRKSGRGQGGRHSHTSVPNCGPNTCNCHHASK